MCTPSPGTAAGSRCCPGNEYKTVNHVSLSIEWNSIRLRDLTHGIVTKTAHKTLPGGGGDEGVAGPRGGVSGDQNCTL